ncbi:MAG TPA: DUF1549 domain-containing protein, partial [Verrucomicrobiae bacterium]|nr:DUF1549 domain-containing protein [Verrucomicrobiae bacterium]
MFVVGALVMAPALEGRAAQVDLTRLPEPAAHPVDFERDIRPVLETKCVRCHGPEKQRSGFRLDSREAALASGDGHAPNIKPGDSARSPLIHFVAGLVPDMRMPEKGEPLSAAQIGLLRSWIDQGARWPATTSTVDPIRSHWAFNPVVRPPLPRKEKQPDSKTARSRGASGANPIDAFVEAKLAGQGLKLSDEANGRTLIRRLYLVMLGVPPAPEEVERFLADAQPRAFERLVDRVLDDSRYGERWGRHWLDVIRFAESNGFETNRERPNAWRFRDYVIAAFNQDKPYDQFIREQLAGDALGIDVATGFLVGGPVDIVGSPDPVLTAQQRADELDDIVSTTGTAFLGLTLGCARCHSH